MGDGDREKAVCRIVPEPQCVTKGLPLGISPSDVLIFSAPVQKWPGIVMCPYRPDEADQDHMGSMDDRVFEFAVQTCQSAIQRKAA